VAIAGFSLHDGLVPDQRGRATPRGVWTLALVASLAVSTWTLAPVRAADATDAPSRPVESLTVSLPEEIFGNSSAGTGPLVAIDAATAYAAGRGLVGVTVIDRRAGATVDNGVGAHTAMGSASVVKVLLAEELLHRASVGQIQLGPSEYARIETMLVNSDDPAASSLYSQFGDVSLIVSAITRHELKESSPPVDPRYWGNTKISAHDVATLYDHVLDGSLPAAEREYLFGLLASLAPVASDGFGQLFGLAGLGPAEHSAVKQGWMCCLDGVRNVHSSAVLGPDERYVVVILTQYPPALPWEYGRTTTTEVARLVLAGLAL